MARAKKEKKEEKKGSRKNKILAETISVILIFLSIFSFLSLVSYNPADPSWASTAIPGQRVSNFGGRLGAQLAETLLQVFGLVALVLPFAFGYLGIRSLFPGQHTRMVRRTLSGVLYLLVLSPLLILILEKFPWKGKEFLAGGLSGQVILGFFVRYLNHTGSFIFLLSLLALLLIFTTHWSLARTIAFLARLFRNTSSSVIIRITEHRKEKKSQTTEVARSELKTPGIPAEKTLSDSETKIFRTPAAPEEKEPARPSERAARISRKKEAGEQEGGMLFPDLRKSGSYRFPPFTLLDPGKPSEKIDREELFEKKRIIEQKLLEFKVSGEVREYHPGPVITTYEFFPDAGIKVSQVASLSEELSLALAAESVRIQRIPGKSSLGIEIPNNKREIIKLRDIIQSEKFQNSASKLTFALGKTVHGEVYVTDLAIMPHLLIAGATGTGKSVALNALIASILYKATPDEVKLILIDPKSLEFTLYDGIPHLLAPVVNDSKKASIILMDAVRKMEERLRILSQAKVRNIEQYNQQVKTMREQKKGKLSDEEKEKLKPLPYIVIIIDELAELMMTSAQDVEYCIGRLAQLARAVGIHLVMASQRPSIDVITGTIKNNFNSRIAFKVPSKVDSRVIIDTVGAEKLLGLGDMLFMPPNYPRIIRLHCAYISVPEVQRLVKFVKEQGEPQYDERILQILKRTGDLLFEEDLGEKDELFDQAVELVLATGQASASFLQRKMKLGYARASRILDQMEQEGIVGPSQGAKPREILVDPRTYLKERQKSKSSDTKS